jgi:hypothetical protein
MSLVPICLVPICLVKEDMMGDYQHIEVRRFAPNLGAEIRGVCLAKGINDDEFA